MTEIKQVVFVKLMVSLSFFTHSKSNGSDAVLKSLNDLCQFVAFLKTHADNILKILMCVTASCSSYLYAFVHQCREYRGPMGP